MFISIINSLFFLSTLVVSGLAHSDFNYPVAEALARKTVMETFLNGKVSIQGSDQEASLLRTRLREPIVSLVAPDVLIGKYSDSASERWADFTVKLDVKTTTGGVINCTGFINIENSNVRKGLWHANSEASDKVRCRAQ